MGRAWFGAIYAVGGLAGELASMAFNPAGTIGVGVSGAITALFAAGRSAGSLHIDVAAHAGGALAGGALGLLFLRGWSRRSLHPAYRRLAAAVARLELARADTAP